jgi:hypothetical protein
MSFKKRDLEILTASRFFQRDFSFNNNSECLPDRHLEVARA